VEHLQASMVGIILKEGKLEQLMPGCLVRYMSHEFAGLAMMIDNLNKDCCLQVLSDCQNSTNVLSTRSTLIAADSIPPLHRQVTSLLTHFEPSQPYVVGHRLTQRLTHFAQLRDFAQAACGMRGNGSGSDMDYLAGEMQNYPQLDTPEVAALHSPRPLYI